MAATKDGPADPARAEAALAMFGGGRCKTTCTTPGRRNSGGVWSQSTAGRLLARLIPGATFVALDGTNHILLEGEPAWPVFLEQVETFLAAD